MPDRAQRPALSSALLKPRVFALRLVPLALLGIDALLGKLSANPIAEVMNRLGFWTLSCCSPRSPRRR